MATKTAAVTQPDAAEAREEGPDAPLLDTLGAELKKLVQKGKERGYVTYDELNAALPPDEVSSEQIEDTMAMLSEAGVNVVEAEEQEEAPAANPAEPAKTAVVAAEATGEDEELGRTDDPGAHVPARDGLGRAAEPRGRDRDRQAHRGRPGQDDRRHLREPDDHHRAAGVARCDQRRPHAAARRDRPRGDPGRRCRARARAAAEGARSTVPRRPRRRCRVRPMPKLPVVRPAPPPHGQRRGGRRRRGRRPKPAPRTTTRTRCRCRRSRRS